MRRGSWIILGIPFIALMLVAMSSLAEDLPTNLSITTSGDNLQLQSSTGNDVYVPLATDSTAGLMSTLDTVRLQELVGPRPTASLVWTSATLARGSDGPANSGTTTAPLSSFTHLGHATTATTGDSLVATAHQGESALNPSRTAGGRPYIAIADETRDYWLQVRTGTRSGSADRSVVIYVRHVRVDGTLVRMIPIYNGVWTMPNAGLSTSVFIPSSEIQSDDRLYLGLVAIEDASITIGNVALIVW